MLKVRSRGLANNFSQVEKNMAGHAGMTGSMGKAHAPY